MISFKNTNGFIYFSSMIFISILGILIIAFPPDSVDSLNTSSAKARDVIKINDVYGILDELTYWYIEGNEYPDLDSCLDIDSVNSDNWSDESLAYRISSYFDSFESLGDNTFNVSSYIFEDDMGCDDRSYYYIADPSGDGTYNFGIYAKLELKDSNNAVSCEALKADKSAQVPALSDEDACYVALPLSVYKS